ncbi:MAG: PIN domain-containing protein [Pseudomonadota bacterium]
MKVLIDANVLYPTVLREITLGVAATGYFTPLWSARILEEWARAAARRDPAQEPIARGEIALLRARWPDAEVAVSPETEATLHLPDPNDIHVLAAAIDGGADELLTMNRADFPTRTLAAHGILRRDPDGFLTEALAAQPADLRRVVTDVHATACRLSGQDLPLRGLLKRARLPRLGKALAG